MWSDQPGKEASHKPVTLPVPGFYFLIRNIKTSGCKTADEMQKEDAYDTPITRLD
jgi:hypothetical protein